FGQRLAKGYLERLLKNPFYVGLFVWEGKTYTGTHSPLITVDQFEQAQAVFRGHNKPKYRKHEFAFRGLLTCAYDNCLVTEGFRRIMASQVCRVATRGTAGVDGDRGLEECWTRETSRRREDLRTRKQGLFSIS